MLVFFKIRTIRNHDGSLGVSSVISVSRDLNKLPSCCQIMRVAKVHMLSSRLEKILQAVKKKAKTFCHDKCKLSQSDQFNPTVETGNDNRQ